MIRFTVKKSGFNVRDYLLLEVNISRQTLKKIKYNGGMIYVNNKPAYVMTPVEKGDHIDLLLPKEVRSESLYPIDISLDIIYEDDFILVLNKPGNLPVIPKIGNDEPSLAHGLIHYYDQFQLPYTVHIVTRLDKNTSGLVLIAKHQLAHGYFRDMPIQRRYLALVEGQMDKTKDVIRLPIKRKPDSIIERCVDPTGKYAETAYELIQTINNMSLVHIQLKTGRTHQIRVHFSHLHHPLLGDTLYGGSDDVVQRQALHCYHLAFKHPYTEEHLSFYAPWPDDLPKIDVPLEALSKRDIIKND